MAGGRQQRSVAASTRRSPASYGRQMAFDLDYFLALPRAAGLALSPDGNRLVTSVGTLNPDRTKYVTALWELDPSGVRPPRRLTRSEAGEAAPAFLPDDSLVFTSSRSDPEGKKADRVDEPTRLWLLPAGGGEARPVADPPGGVDGLATARCAPTVVVECGVFAGCQDADADRAREQSRRDAGVRGVLFEEYPIKYWDHELGPREPRLHATAVDPAELASVVAEPTDRSAELVDLTPVPGRALDNAEFALTPDGRTVVTTCLTGHPTWSPSTSPPRRAECWPPRPAPTTPPPRCLRTGAGWSASGKPPVRRIAPTTPPCGWSSWPPGPVATPPPTSTWGPQRRSGLRIPPRSSSSRTLVAAPLSSACSSTPARSPGSPPTVPTPTCARPQTAAPSTPCGPPGTHRRRRSRWTLPRSTSRPHSCCPRRGYPSTYRVR